MASPARLTPARALQRLGLVNTSRSAESTGSQITKRRASFAVKAQDIFREAFNHAWDEYGGDEDTAIAALLHDVVEDAGGQPRLADVRARFGAAVADIVEGCSDADTIPKPPWRGRKERYIARLTGESAAVQLVSAADKLHNARSLLADHFEMGPALWDRFSGGREGTLWYYRTLVGCYSKAPPALVRELDRVVTALESRATAEDRS